MSTRRKIAFAALAVILLVTGFLFGFRWYLISRVEKLRAELRAKGEKLTVQELRAGIRPPETNGAPDLLAAMSKLGTRGEKVFNSYLSMHKLSKGHAIVGWKQPELGGSSPDHTNTWRDLEAELIEIRPTLDAISAALKNSAFDFALDYSKGSSSVGTTTLIQLRRTSQTLASRTGVHLHAHQLEPALASLREQLSLSGVLRQEPIVLLQTFRSALVSFAFSSTWEALQADGWSDDQLRLMQSEWQKHEFLTALHETLLIERAVTQSTINQARLSSLNINQIVGASGGNGPAETALEVTRETAQNLWEDTTGMLWSWLASYNDEYVCLSAYQQMIEQEKLAAARRSYKIAHDALFDANQAQSLYVGSSLAQIMIGLWSNCLSRPFLEETERDLAVTAIALKRYSLRYSKLPSQLSELVPEFLGSVPIDSMDGQSLRYRLNSNGTFLLYSVGKDGRDDGGDTTSVRENAKGYSAARDFIWPVAADPEEVMRYNEEAGNKIQKIIEQKARGSRSTNRSSSIEK